jgi:hypothetical protein
MRNMKEYGKRAIVAILLIAFFAALLLEFSSAGQSAAASCVLGTP